MSIDSVEYGEKIIKTAIDKFGRIGESKNTKYCCCLKFNNIQKIGISTKHLMYLRARNISFFALL